MAPKTADDLKPTHVARLFSSSTWTRSIAFLFCVLSLVAQVPVTTGKESLEHSQHRYKRNVLQLCELVALYTGRWCYRYNRYGCYCGLRTSTVAPVDSVDSCCRNHDNCYASLGDGCAFFPSIVTTYQKECSGNVCRCTDSPTVNSCEYRTCQCDVTFAQCLQSTTYNRSFYKYKRSRCQS
ncbi:unnamed protein product [Candidula unifasciata]|uniref:phospholipase A2 n=1 Tax=Candidula unifasciata TaxID=100452 RepID=A0A8S3YXH0_9EUPU|nr:unnamed protein product [Candidula unifasciata]